MKLELTFFNSLCECEVFRINGKNAKHEDFGEHFDRSPDTADEYGCGDMRFTPNPPADEVLEKYNITVDEYEEIATELEDKLSFGCCGWCI